MKGTAAWVIFFSIGIFCPALASHAAAADSQSTGVPAGPTNTAKTRAATTPAPRMATDVALLHPATLKERAPDVYDVVFTTTKGEFVIQVTRAWAPLGADRFYNLVKHGFFTNASFFRVVPGFVVQFGISGDPKVSAVWDTATIKDDPVRGSNKVGFITFAMGGPNTRTTQVFINLRDNGSALDGMGFAPFGQVTSGMEVVEKLYSGYGDLPEMGGRGPSEEAISRGGKAYLDKSFPMLDSIKMATVSPATGAGPGNPTAH
ncbi:MAG TPA: peptidylprolyl isomerase [Candidatus Acidoferrales bacterium]|nr:peptidylprolyl isomerase [Candidatus Acidoferrales bacterium]